MTPPPNRPRRTRAALVALVVSALAVPMTLTAPDIASADDTPELVEERLVGTGDSWTFRDTSTDPFSTLGISWDGDVTPTVRFRTFTNGSWTPWAEADRTESTPAEATRVGTDPLWVGDSTGVEVRLSGRVRDARVTLVDPGAAGTPAPRTMTTRSQAQAPSTMSSRSASAYVPPQPAMISRAQWGADESWRCSRVNLTSTVQAAIVHHTAGSNSYTSAQSAGVVRGIYAYHTKTLGWCDVGYNVLVDRYGQVFEGRAGGLDQPVLGAHATSWNTDTTGVSFMGNFETGAAPAVMLEAGAAVIAYKFGIHGRDPNGRVTLAGKNISRISGHGDVMNTACPGKNVRGQLPWLRNRVATLLSGGGQNPQPSAPTTDIGKRWTALGAQNGYLGWPTAAESRVADGSWRPYRAHDMFASPRTAAFWTSGDVRTRYRELGTAGSSLGFPTSDTRNSWPISGATGSAFEKGWLITSAAHGPHLITGDFYQRYRSSSSLRSRLGVPVTDAARSGFGTTSQLFSQGRLFENRGSWAMHGQIYGHWNARTDSHKLLLGQPMADQVSVTASATKTRATVQRLTQSTYVARGSSTLVVQGSVHPHWRKLGAERSKLGLPTANQSTTRGTSSQTFERGTLTVSPQGKVTVRYR